MATADQTSRSAKDMAVSLLARREYSRHELFQRLSRHALPEADIDDCLTWLMEHDLQSDSRFAESFVRSRIQRGQGPRRIQSDLDQRGIHSDLIASAIEEVVEQEDVDWFELAAQVLSRKFSSPPRDVKEKARQQRFLAGRGFLHDQIRHALETGTQGPS